jgi:glucokinase
MKRLAIDIGGTHLRGELWDESSTLTLPRVESSNVGLLAYIEQTLGTYPDIAFIGISYAGQVNGGIILSSPNIDVDESCIKEVIESRYGVRVEIDNDLNCAALAEGADWQCDHLAVLYLGTGTGAAVIEEGRLIRGSRNMAYEIGHIPYRDAPFSCGCGRHNCIELYASGSGMEKWLHHYGSPASPRLERLRDSVIEYEHDIAREFERALLHTAGTLITLSNPRMLVLGGGIIEENPYLVECVRARISEFALTASLESLRIEKSRLRNGSLEGAKLLERVARHG